MMLFRPADLDDLEGIHELAHLSGTGLTTLPKDKNILKKRLIKSVHSFQKKVRLPTDEYYLFVLTCPITSKIIGTSAIQANTGYDSPFYSFQLSKEKKICHELNIERESELLTLTRALEGRSEICTLFLDPKYRVHHHGLLLLRARFLFIMQFKERFMTNLIAELRGVSDDQGNSPFFEHVGQHFLQMPFAKADELTLTTQKQFIQDLMPEHPLYVSLLDKRAKAVIGKPHPETLPAMKILLKEGFQDDNMVDIFDAGPTLEIPIPSIKTITNAKILELKGVSSEFQGEVHIVANSKLAFRATSSPVDINFGEQSCTLPKETVELLQLKPQEKICISPLRNIT